MFITVNLYCIKCYKNKDDLTKRINTNFDTRHPTENALCASSLLKYCALLLKHEAFHNTILLLNQYGFCPKKIHDLKN